ncbi:MAG: hypothetical protein DMF91_08025 [Acidobacteria bacterium]|nr:MAG: hypothetical protein DMF91_08025 [Acidobacteriota bacterium]
MKSYSSCLGSGGRLSSSSGGTRGASTCWLIRSAGGLFGPVSFCSASASISRSRFGLANASATCRRMVAAAAGTIKSPWRASGRSVVFSMSASVFWRVRRPISALAAAPVWPGMRLPACAACFRYG